MKLMLTINILLLLLHCQQLSKSYFLEHVISIKALIRAVKLINKEKIIADNKGRVPKFKSTKVWSLTYSADLLR